MQTIRIFISSPGDVQDEREQARRVIADLQKRYGGEVNLQPLLWEDLPLQPDLNFQQAIELILSKKGVDIAIFILWSRLGSEVAGISKSDGSVYRSGTEREFDLMMAARQFSEEIEKRPDILVYTRSDDRAFTGSLDSKDTSQLKQLVEQKSLVENFIRENFVDAAGRNLRAYHTFPKPVDFASRLRVHLIELLDEKLAAPAKVIWEENPYRGLLAFQTEHAAVFFGRERETDELARLLRSRERDREDGCAFACVVGASGSGKSSLVRAGLADELLHHPVTSDDGSTPSWRFQAITPSEFAADFHLHLAKEWLISFPSLGETTPVEELVSALREAPGAFLNLSLKPAISKAGRQNGNPVKTLLLIDQFEEFFTHPSLKDVPLLTDSVLPLLDLLARSGLFWVVVTLRSDFYPSAQALPAFLKLRGSRNFDLLPPDSSSLRRIISRPATLAGCAFEVLDQKSGRTLADELAVEIEKQPEALPLLQFTLEELYERRSAEQRLTKQAYDALGGLSGAVNRRADEVLADLEKIHGAGEVEQSFRQVFSQLFELDSSSGMERPVRRVVLDTELTSSSGQTGATADLLDAFTAARLLMTRDVAGQRAFTVVHEALLHGWARLVDLRKRDEENLKRRARLRAYHAGYLATPIPSLFLPEGLPLNEGQQILTESPHLLHPREQDYVKNSAARCRAIKTRRRILVGSTLALMALLTLMVGGAYLEAKKQRQQAITARDHAEQAREIADAARETAAGALAKELENLKVYQASNQRTFQAIEKYFKDLPSGELTSMIDKFVTIVRESYHKTPVELRTAKHQNDFASILEMQCVLTVRQVKGRSLPEILNLVTKAKKAFEESLASRREGLSMKPDPALCIAVAEQFSTQGAMGKDLPPEARPFVKPLLVEKQKIILDYLAAIPADYSFYGEQVTPLRNKIEGLRFD